MDLRAQVLCMDAGWCQGVCVGWGGGVCVCVVCVCVWVYVNEYVLIRFTKYDELCMSFFVCVGRETMLLLLLSSL